MGSITTKFSDLFLDRAYNKDSLIAFIYVVGLGVFLMLTISILLFFNWARIK